MCDIICCETDTSAGVLQGAPVFQDPFCPRSLECCIANTDLPERVICSVWLPSTLAAFTALRTCRDFFPLLTLNYSLNSSLEITLEIEVFSLLLHAFQVASVWSKGSLEARLGITRLLLSLRCQTFTLNVFHKELYKLRTFVFWYVVKEQQPLLSLDKISSCKSFWFLIFATAFNFGLCDGS